MGFKYSGLTDKTRQEMVEDLQEFSIYMNGLGFEVYLHYGTLLGAVRNKGLILHDNDLDLGYISKETKPKKVIEEARELMKQFEKDGWFGAYFDMNSNKIRDKGVISDTAGQMHIMTRRDHCTDLFTTWFDNRGNWWNHQWGILAKKEDTLPLKEVVCEGVVMKAPKDTDKILKRLYGSDWMIPQEKKIQQVTDIRMLLLHFLRRDECILKIDIKDFEDLQEEAKKEGVFFTHLDKMIHYGYFIDGEIVGFSGYCPVSKTEVCFKNSYTLPEHRGKGVSTKLNWHRLEKARKAGYKKYFGFCTKDNLGLQLKAGAKQGETDGVYTKTTGKL